MAKRRCPRCEEDLCICATSHIPSQEEIEAYKRLFNKEAQERLKSMYNNCPPSQIRRSDREAQKFKLNGRNCKGKSIGDT